MNLRELLRTAFGPIPFENMKDVERTLKARVIVMGIIFAVCLILMGIIWLTDWVVS